MPPRRFTQTTAEIEQQIATLRAYEQQLGDELPTAKSYARFITLHKLQRTTRDEIYTLSTKRDTLLTLTSPTAPLVRAPHERAFEQQVILPMLDTWGLAYATQYQCGLSNDSTGRIDVYVHERNGPLTIFENKATLQNDIQRTAALRQAMSYALHVGAPSFVIASPEAMWVYSLSWNVEKLCATFTREQMQRADDTIRLLLLAIRKKQKKPRHEAPQ